MNKTVGTVTLVGAGCDKGLITLSGLKAIRKSEVLIYDDLIDSELVYEAPQDAELIYVGKRFAEHSKRQNEIEKLIIEKAMEGKYVVRLKGGDSYVFGRGGEEMLALREAGISANVIPGICSGIAVPEHLGIPVTHRGVAQSVTMITGHTASDLHENYEALAKLSGTLVFFMGINSAPQIAKELMRYGKPADTPVAICCNGYRFNEKMVKGTLSQMEELVKEAETPALLLIGKVADFDLRLEELRPLSGVSVTVTGTEYFTEKLSAKLSDLGAYVRKLPGLTITPIEGAIPPSFEGYHWLVFTSANGIRIFFDSLKKNKTDLRSLAALKFACIGKGTQDKLLEYGIHADFVPKDFTAEVLGHELAAEIHSDEKVMILRAENGSEKLNQELDAAGVDYTDIKIYRSEMAERTVINKQSESTDYVVFASAFGAKSFLSNHSLSETTKVVCIGEATAKALGNRSCIMPKEHTADAIINKILEDVSNEKI